MNLHEALYLWGGITLGTFLGAGICGLFTRKKAAEADDVLEALIEMRHYRYSRVPDEAIARADTAIAHATETQP
jgi:hypothetical protein